VFFLLFGLKKGGYIQADKKMVGALGLLVSVDSYKFYRNPLLQQIDQHTSQRRFAIYHNLSLWTRYLYIFKV
jgi:hypothetical protein